MARPLRIERPGAWYHVTARGTERRAIFADERDRRRWLGLLAEAVALFDLVVHGYVLMDNHYHLILETRQANLSRAMQWLQTSYSMGFNRRHGRVGPLFQGRFKAVVVEAAGWGLELSRYVHLNPVRTARMGLDKRARQTDRLGARGRPDAHQVRQRVPRLRQYRWSSYRAYVGLEKAPGWLTCSRVLELGAGRGTIGERQRKYMQYVEEAVREGLQASPWEHVQGQLVLGGRDFLDKICRKVRGWHREQPQRRALNRRPGWKEVVKAVEALRREKWEAFRDRHGDWGREAALYLGRRKCGLRLAELGAAVGGADYAAVSAAIKRFERRLSRERSLQQSVESLTEMLNVET
jgi:REP-associated tyrosine transposase